MIPVSNIDPQRNLEFEVRLIVWEIKNAPIPPGKKAVDLFAKVNLFKNYTLK